MKKKISFLVYFFSFMIPFAIIFATGMPDYQNVTVVFSIIIFAGFVFPYHFFRIRRFRKAGIEEPNLLWLKNHPRTFIAYNVLFLLAIGFIFFRMHYYSFPKAKALSDEYYSRVKASQPSRK